MLTTAQAQDSGEPVRGSWRWGRTVFAGTASVAVLVALFYFLRGESSLTATLAEARWGNLVPAVLLVLINLALAATRATLVYRAMGYTVSWYDALRAILAAWPIMVITPARAGELLRAGYLKSVVPISEGIGAVFAEKLIDAQSLFLVAAIGAGYAGQTEVCVAAFGVLAGSGLAFWLLGAHANRITGLRLFSRYEAKLSALALAFRRLLAKPYSLMKVTLLSWLSFCNVVLLMVVLLRFARVDVPLATVAALWPIAVFAGLIPLTLAGLGTRDGVFVYLLTAIAGLEVEPTQVLLATVSYSVIGVWLCAIIGLPFLIQGPPHATQIAGSNPTRE